MSTTTQIAPENVLDALGRHMLVDGYHVVMDLDRSRGSVRLRQPPRRRGPRPLLALRDGARSATTTRS